ncbi:MAG: hypothetical protein HEQ20_23345 [Aphanizomenon flos-aquae KM1D3_PB]|nr:MAG: hypothetical protein HEQ20_23345 [Aphanizomenon flos-aquae KM1D3_PB]
MPTFNEQTGTANPFNGFDVGISSKPTFADIDGDGDLDAVVGENDGTLNYYKNTGTATNPSYTEQTGTANPFNGIDVGGSSAPTFADIDGDGDLDAVVGEWDGTLNYYKNTGTATNPSYTEQTGTANPFNGIDVGSFSAHTLADIDGDGDLDAVVGENDGILLYYKNTGTATNPSYTEQTGTANPFNGIDAGNYSIPTLADIDGDGDLDAVVGEWDGTLKYYENTGTATNPSYTEQTGTANPFNGFDAGNYSIPTLADIDGDGDLDAVVGENDGILLYYQNTEVPITPSYTEQTGTANPFNGFDVGISSKPTFADIDGDGDLDAVVGENDGTLNYYKNTGTATNPSYTEQTGTANPFNGFDVGISSKPTFADIDGDGDLDAVVGENDGTLNYYKNTGTATNPSYTEQTGTANPFNGIDVGISSKPTFADIDGDGDLDAVVGENDGTLNYYKNTGTATNPSYTEQTGTANPFNGIDVGGSSAPTFADIDGDGDLDAVVGESDGILLYYKNTGTATNPSYTEQTGTANPFNGFDAGNYSIPTLADIDGDGDLDAVVGEFDGILLYYQANRTPTNLTLSSTTVAENQVSGTVIGNFTTTDPDTGNTFTYTLASGTGDTNNSSFTIAGNQLQTNAAFDYETKNSYSIRVKTTDQGGLSFEKELTIGVTDVNEAPVITSAATATFAENGTGTVYTVTATDVDAATTLTYSLSGTDANLFNITNGVVTFKTAPNFEAPGDNVYDINVIASDGTLTATQAVAITVTNVNEAPVITSAATATFAENGTGTVYTVTATDVDAATNLTYSLSGTDASFFNINNGAVTFKTAPNFEAPGDNVYDINVIASDGTLTATQAVAITVTNVNEAPVITSAATATFAENGTGTVYTVTATDVDAGTNLTYSLSGTDAGLFNINNGEVTFKTAPNFEAPGDNVYDINVIASDGTLTATQAVAITVTNVNEAPVITSAATATFAENGTGTVYTVTATDADAGTTLTYSLSGTDAGLFNINNGAVTFKTAPNFEVPTDNGANNVYDINVIASDGALTATQAVAITVTNVNEAPVITSAATATFAENGTGTVYTVTATDAEGTTLTYSLSGTDAGLFNINNGAVTFKTAPNFEAPGDNVYDINVIASDGTLTATQAVAITVTNVNEAPVITSAATATFAENGTGTVYTVTATDVDAGTNLTYSLSGTDAGLFNINNGEVTFKTAPNFEAPGDNVYDINVIASDGTLTATQAVAITVTNVNEAPVITSAATATFAENGTGTVYTVTATDADAGTTLTYSLSGTDAGLFNINNGAVTFKTAPNFEVPTDNGANNVYDINVIASDGALTATQAVAITVTNVNEAPVITSAATATFAENGTGTVYTVTATDAEGTTLTYSLSGTDAGLFNINNGAVTFKTAPNFEVPTDNGANNVYDINVIASDGALTATQAVAITVTNVNEAPVITSAATATFAENGTGTVYTVTATDAEGTTLTYSLSGTDASFFNITNGVVTFKTAPNFEVPTDNGANNVYDINVIASDGTLTATQAVAITVTNVNEAPVITSAATANFAENGTGTVYTVTATDVDAATNLTYSLSGTDASFFNINNGAVTFKTAPNFEAPGDNVYDINVIASDGTLTATQAVAITVTNVNEAPVITSAATATFAENGTGTVYTVTATDVDAGTNLTYSLSGTDAGLFNINNGEVTFKTAPNFEAPGDNVYDINVIASDGTLTATQAVAITVTNVNEAPVITSAATATFAENGTGTVYTVTATDADAGTTLTYSLSGTDAGLFNINNGAVTFKTAPNFEVPTDNGANNVYDINVIASDGALTATQAVAITVTNVNEAPVITSAATATFAENGTGTVYTVTATDAEGTTLTYSLSGTDAGLFNINNGAVTFKTAPNFEVPTDNGANNVYDINVIASDGALTATQAVAITVTNVNEAPVITSAATATFAENGTGTVYTVTATDAEGTTLTYSLSGTDASFFNITNGVVTFKTAPNFEVPTDNGANNVYDINVIASDGTLTATQAVAITVTNVNEAPVITSAATANFAENGTGTVYTVTATDVDAATNLTYSLSGTDASFFNINNGAVTFKTAPNFEAPGDNVYDINVIASDGTLTATQAVAITVTNVNEAPVITSAATATFAENATGTVYTVTATDVDAGTTLTYSLSGTDAGLFNINNGAVTFKTVPNFEAPGDNVYDINVIASDGTLTATQAVAITVTNVNEAPVITSAATATFAENGTGTVYIVTATDVDAATNLTYSLSGTDASFFNINNGAVTFKTAPNFEAPGDNVYDINVIASDGTLTATQAVAITVTNVNEAPVITSAATATFAENATGTIYTVTATDVDAGTTLTYSLSGTDAGLFNINNGAVTFKTVPNFEAPGDNVYDINVIASDGTLTATQAVAITVTNVNEAPVITSAATATFAENGTGTVYTVTATDVDAGTNLTYSLSGTDAGLFNINNGEVTFKTAPNFEAPGDNVYDINVIASDGTLTATQAVAITVTNVNEAPVITSAATATFAENGTGTVYTVTATDVDAGTTFTYSLSGTDASFFNITNGVVTFKTAPNFEAPGDNVYDINVIASDGTLTATQAVAITVTNVNEAPVITSAATATFAENGTGTVYTVTATDVDAGTTLTYSLSGTDANLFNITNGVVTFKTAPNFEVPTDNGANNVYYINVIASDGALTATQAVAITVTNVNEAPVITSAATANFAENGTGTVYTVTATDVDAATNLTYSLSGTDASFFNINNGAVTFKTAPNFEAPGDNVYDINVIASDGTLTATQAVAITVTNVNEAPVITSAATATFAENATGTVYTVTATDVDAGTTLTYSLSGTDAGLFNINNGEVTFKTAPNFEVPTDNGADNVYDINVIASDGTLTDTEAVAITVTNVNEAPVITSAATATFAENGTGTVYTVTATDVDAGTTLTYSLSGTDANLFNITNGEVTFKTAPNFEVPTDNGANNVYYINVIASDGALTATQAVAITVTNVNEAPVITSAATANFAENGTGTVYTVTATDVDAATNLTYSLSGTDASFFNINNGAVTFKTVPNFEAPGDNVYDINVIASDGTLTATQAVAITVTNVNEAPVITSAATATFAENATGTVYTVTATDVDAGTTLTYSLSGTDASFFNITNGVVTFKTAPNFEVPTDNGANNVYDINVIASDGTLTATQAVAITVTNVNEAPVITSAATATFAENATGTIYTVTATDVDAGTTLTYSLSGTDAGLFNINNGAVTFKTVPNFEAPGDNVYDINVIASDGTLTATQAVAITVTNVNEAPVITSAATATFAENATGTVYTVTATDVDAGTTLTYSLSGTDAGLFNINNGAVTFKTAPNFEVPTDNGANNVYDINVIASDGALTATQAVAITVTNVNEAPVITSAATATFAENGTGTVYTVTATDVDAGTTLTYSLSGTDAGLFNIT